MGGSLPDIDGLEAEAVRALVLELVERLSALQAENAALREEIARLKGLNGRPRLKPSAMSEKANTRQKAKQGRKQAKRSRGAKRLAIDEDRVIAMPHPAGSRFKGYEDYVAQELVIKRRVVRYRRERWVTPEGRRLVAPLPAGLRGHFGPELRRFVLAAYHQGQTTIERLLALLCDLGVAISKRQLVRLLSERQEAFVAEAEAVLESGLESARWISVDDTGARHQARNAITTQIGNDHFTWFATTACKSRLNFLELLAAGREDYVINQAAVAYMKGRNLSASLIARLEAAGARRFTGRAAWTAHLEHLGITALKVQPDLIRIATEAALWGAVRERGRLAETVILSDDAGQFKVGQHALCWVHAERLIHKLDAFCQRRQRQKERIRTRIWWLYADLKAYREEPSKRRKRELSRRFDAIFTTRTGFASLDRLLTRLHANKAELLMVCTALGK